MSTSEALLSRHSGVKSVSLDPATRHSLESTLEALDDLLSELAHVTPGRRRSWLHYCETDWLRPLVGVGIELKAIAVFGAFDPMRAVGVARALSDLVQHRTASTFALRYAGLREGWSAFDIHLLSQCLRLEHLFRTAIVRGRNRR